MLVSTVSTEQFAGGCGFAGAAGGGGGAAAGCCCIGGGAGAKVDGCGGPGWKLCCWCCGAPYACAEGGGVGAFAPYAGCSTRCGMIGGGVAGAGLNEAAGATDEGGGGGAREGGCCGGPPICCCCCGIMGVGTIIPGIGGGAW